MPEYRNMTAKEAIRAAKEESGLTIEQIARRLNVSTSVIKRYLKEDDVYSPRLDMLPSSYVVLGNTLLLGWMAGQIRRDDDERRNKMVSLLTNAIDVLEKERRGNACLKHGFGKRRGGLGRRARRIPFPAIRFLDPPRGRSRFGRDRVALRGLRSLGIPAPPGVFSGTR